MKKRKGKLIEKKWTKKIIEEKKTKEKKNWENWNMHIKTVNKKKE